MTTPTALPNVTHDIVAKLWNLCNILKDDGVTYQRCSSKVFTDKVTLPETWLFVSGEHTLDVVYEDEAK